jgi:hypothetical protein
VEGGKQERVKAIFYPRDAKTDKPKKDREAATAVPTLTAAQRCAN